MKQVLLALMLISVVYSQQDMITSDPFPLWENDVINLLEEIDKNNEYTSANKNFVLKNSLNFLHLE